MSITGISSYSYYQYQNNMNLLQLSGLKQTARYQSVQAVNKVSSGSSSNTSSVQSFLKSYQKELTALEEAASKLMESSSKNVFNDYKVASTDSGVADASAVYRLESDTDITLKVHATAQAQRNASVAHYGQDEVSAGADMNFEIAGADGNRISVSVSSMNENGTAKTYNQMYQDAAKSINAQADSGIKASVVNQDGKVSLVLASKKEGAANGFSITGSTGAAAGIENAYIQAQDAEYSVTEKGFTQEFRSDSNRISLDYGRIEADLKGTGETRIYTGVDEDDIVSAVKDLMDGYNSVRSLLQDNSGRGTGAAAHLRSFERGMAAEKTLNAIGISYDKNGDMVLDEKKLREALEEDYEGTKSIIGGQFGIAEKAASRADQALSDSVQRIASNDLSSTVQQQNDSSSYFRYFSNFARSGYNLGNYYTVGMLMNTLA